MNDDSVLREVRAAREEYAKAHDFDVRRIVADLQELDRAGDHTVVRLAPRRPQAVGRPSVVPTHGENSGSAELLTSNGQPFPAK